MGIYELFDSIKNWTSETIIGAQTAIRKPKPKRLPNLGENVRQVVQAEEFDRVMQTASPYLMASLGAWPGIWLYRGFDYHSHRAHVPLPIYIRQTFYQAKLLQFAIIMVGIFSVLKANRRACRDAAAQYMD